MVLGQRTTNQARTEQREVRRVDERIALLEPNIGALITLTNRMNLRTPIFATKREWYEDDYAARWDQATIAVANNTGSTTVTVTDGTKFVVGQMVAVPKASTVTAVPEVIRVTAIAGNVLTVARAVGGVGLDTIAANGPLRLIGTAKEEGSVIGVMKSTAPVLKSNFTQIFETVIDFTKTNVAIKQYGTPGSDRERELNKKLKEHKIDMNGAFLWGVPSENMTGGATGKPLRTMGGLNYYVTSNITDAAGSLSWKTFNSFSRQAFRYGNSEKILLASPLICEAINNWGHNFLQVKPGETKLGVRIQEIEMAHGTWMLVKDWMLEDGVANQTGFGHVAFSLDMEEIEYSPLNNNGENRDTHLRRDVVKDGRDSYLDQILTECTMKVGMEKYHAKLINVTDYQA
jgi:hypothetical protein